MVIFNGKKEAETILMEIKEKILEKKIEPVLSIISVGENPASRLFIKNKKKEAKRIGIKINHYKFKETVFEEEISHKIEELSSDKDVNGIVVQLPLPKKFKTDKIIAKINPQKDVDGFHKTNRELLEGGKDPYFEPPFPSAILIALKTASQDLKNKKVLAVVKSRIFGDTLKDFFKKEKIKISLIVKKKNYFLDIRTKLKSADAIIIACGCVKEIKGDMIKEGAILIDGSIIVLSNGKVVGDVDGKSVAKKAAFLTPVPGGIGPLTVALLLKNVYYAAERS